MKHPPCICEREGQVSAGAWRPASLYIPRTRLRARGGVGGVAAGHRRMFPYTFASARGRMKSFCQHP